MHINLALTTVLMANLWAEPWMAQNPVGQPMSKADELTVRRCVYEGTFTTAFPMEGKWANFTILVVPEELEKIYEKNKSATLELLLVIVKGARPEDALLAAAYATALARSPVGAAFLTSVKPGDVDKVDKKSGSTKREEFCKQVSKYVERAK